MNGKEFFFCSCFTRVVAYPPLPFNGAAPLDGLHLYDGGVDVKECTVCVCATCHACLVKCKLPRFALANGLDAGVIPVCFRGLTLPEEMVLGWNRVHACVVRLRGDTNLPLDCQQRALKGNCIAFPQRLVDVTRQHVVPLRLRDLTQTLYIMFVGNAKPPRECATMRGLFAVRHSRVRECWKYLRCHNEWYRSIDPDPWSDIALFEYEDGAMPRALYDTVQLVSNAHDVGDGHGYAVGDDDMVNGAYMSGVGADSSSWRSASSSVCGTAAVVCVAGVCVCCVLCVLCPCCMCSLS